MADFDYYIKCFELKPTRNDKELASLKKIQGVNIAYYCIPQLRTFKGKCEDWVEPNINPTSHLLKSFKDLYKFVCEMKLVVKYTRKSIVMPPFPLDNYGRLFFMESIVKAKLFQTENLATRKLTCIDNPKYNGDFIGVFSGILDLNNHDNETTYVQGSIADPNEKEKVLKAYDEAKFEIKEFGLPVGCIFRSVRYGKATQVVYQCPVRHIMNYGMSLKRGSDNIFKVFLEDIAKESKVEDFTKYMRYIKKTTEISVEVTPKSYKNNSTPLETAYKRDEEGNSMILFTNEIDVSSCKERKESKSLFQTYCLLLTTTHRVVDTTDTFTFYDPYLYKYLLGAADIIFEKLLNMKDITTSQAVFHTMQGIHYYYSLYCYNTGIYYSISGPELLSKYDRGVMFLVECNAIPPLSLL